jgi:hypothetical protein
MCVEARKIQEVSQYGGDVPKVNMFLQTPVKCA